MKGSKDFKKSQKGHEGLYPKVQSFKSLKTQDETYTEVFNEIEALMENPGTFKVAIDGNSGAGKSTLGKILRTRYNCNIFHMDDFFLRPWQRTEDRLKEPGGNVDYLRFKEEVMEAIEAGREFRYRPYDCKTGDFADYKKVKPQKLNIIEGVYSMHPKLLAYYELKIFLGIDPKEQSRRILSRSGPLMHKRFLEEWIPLEDRYFETLNIQGKSDIVIHFG